MSASRTKFPKNVVPARSIHGGSTIIGKNGLPVDALATLEPGSTIIAPSTTNVTYSIPQITVDVSIDLTLLTNYLKYKHTGIFLYTDSIGSHYFIDPDSINDTTKTFNIYTDQDFTSSPTSIGTAKDWFASEAELVNRLQTTSSAVIDSVEFRDVEVKLNLDGDPVSIIDSDGNELEINPDGSINTTANAADTPSISNIAIPTANTEQSFAFPNDTKKISFKLRGNGKLKYAYTSGQSGTNFITAYPGNTVTITDILLTAGLTIYFQSTKSGEVLEILSWS